MSVNLYVTFLPSAYRRRRNRGVTRTWCLAYDYSSSFGQEKKYFSAIALS